MQPRLRNTMDCGEDFFLNYLFAPPTENVLFRLLRSSNLSLRVCAVFGMAGGDPRTEGRIRSPIITRSSTPNHHVASHTFSRNRSIEGVK